MNRIFCLDDEGLFVQDLDDSAQGSIHEATVLVQVLRQPNLHPLEKPQAASSIERDQQGRFVLLSNLEPQGIVCALLLH